MLTDSTAELKDVVLLNQQRCLTTVFYRTKKQTAQFLVITLSNNFNPLSVVRKF